MFFLQNQKKISREVTKKKKTGRISYWSELKIHSTWDSKRSQMQSWSLILMFTFLPSEYFNRRSRDGSATVHHIIRKPNKEYSWCTESFQCSTTNNILSFSQELLGIIQKVSQQMYSPVRLFYSFIIVLRWDGLSKSFLRRVHKQANLEVFQQSWGSGTT